jgi:acyl-CoA thioesterase YciA
MAKENLMSEPPPQSAAAAPGAQGEPAIRVLMMPKDTNAMGTIFGGIILSYIDQAGAIPAHRLTPNRIVTVAMREIVFHEPVFVGDLVSFYAEVARVGTTSITVDVVVEAERPGPEARRVKVTQASVTYVNVDDRGKPTPLPRKGVRQR